MQLMATTSDTVDAPLDTVLSLLAESLHIGAKLNPSPPQVLQKQNLSRLCLLERSPNIFALSCASLVLFKMIDILILT
jgi:hypothetical protein